MDIGKLFRDAWGLFVKDVGPLIVGMLIASIVPAIAAVAIVALTLGTSMRGLQVDSQGHITGVHSMNWVAFTVGMVAVLAVLLLLTVPLYVGVLTGVLRRVREGRQMGYGDAFDGFRVFGRVIWAALVLAFVFAVIFCVPTAAIVAAAAASSWILGVLAAVLVIVAVILYWYLWVSWAYVFPVVVDRGVSVGEALGESRGLVHRTGWWWTFLVLFLLELVIGAISFALGLIPIVGAVATIVLYPFVLTYVVAMYMQARGEGELIDAVTGYRPVVAGATAAYSGPVSPYTGAPVPPPPAAPPPAGQTYAPAAPPQGAPPAHSSADVPPAAPPPPERPSMPEPPTPPEPPAPAAGA